MDFNENKKRKRRTEIDPGNIIYGKVPPQAKDLEHAVLGALMLNNASLDLVTELINEDSFYVDANKKIFNAILSLNARSLPFDMMMVVEELRTKEQLELVGGPYYVVKLTNAVVSDANIQAHSGIIAQKALQRDLIKLGGELISDGYEDSTNPFDLLDTAEAKVTELSTGMRVTSYSHVSTGLMKALERMDELKALGQSITGVPAGFESIDTVTHGWQPTDLIILAARPSVGKTALALNLARNAAMNTIKPTAVGFFSLEMSIAQLTNRLIAAESGVYLEKINTGTFNDYDNGLIMDAVKKIERAPIFIDDTPGLSFFTLRSKARNLKRKEDVGMIIIDYLQLMEGDAKSNNREQEISKISRGLKGLAKELGIPIIALSQLSRATETRSGDKKMPQLSDLRESGAIEQDADMVMFIYRPEYYDINSNENGDSTKGETHIRIAKHRNGHLDTIKLRADLATQKFHPFDGGHFFISTTGAPIYFPKRNDDFDDGGPF